MVGEVRDVETNKDRQKKGGGGLCVCVYIYIFYETLHWLLLLLLLGKFMTKFFVTKLAVHSLKLYEKVCINNVYTGGKQN
jgi:hypothetical protein